MVKQSTSAFFLLMAVTATLGGCGDAGDSPPATPPALVTSPDALDKTPFDPAQKLAEVRKAITKGMSIGYSGWEATRPLSLAASNREAEWERTNISLIIDVLETSERGALIRWSENGQMREEFCAWDDFLAMPFLTLRSVEGATQVLSEADTVKVGLAQYQCERMQLSVPSPFKVDGAQKDDIRHIIWWSKDRPGLAVRYHVMSPTYRQELTLQALKGVE